MEVGGCRKGTRKFQIWIGTEIRRLIKQQNTPKSSEKNHDLASDQIDKQLGPTGKQ